MSRHERGCFRNPTRYCDLCEVKWPVPELQERASQVPDVPEIGDCTVPHRELVDFVDELIDLAGGCPCCVMSAIMQATIKIILPFDFKLERDEWSRYPR